MTIGNNLIKPNDFCILVSEKKLKGSGLKRGDVFLIAGVKPAPTSLKDPYLQRIYVVGIKFVNKKPEVPKEDNEYRAYLIDPRNLEKLPLEEQEVLTQQLTSYYENLNAATN